MLNALPRFIEHEMAEKFVEALPTSLKMSAADLGALWGAGSARRRHWKCHR